MTATQKLATYTAREFLKLDLPDEWRQELIDGHLVSMTPLGGPHQVLHGRMIGLAYVGLANRPGCTPRPEAGVAVDGLDGDQWYEADIAVSCVPPHPGDEGLVQEPILIVEILSLSTDRKDKRKKLPRYKLIPSVREIV
jgi:Uma2 family endonuclease